MKTTKERAASYETLMPLLAAMFREFQDLTKKKPDAALNPNKISMVNRLLEDVLELLKDEPSAKYLGLLDDVQVPQNSDVLLTLGQFDAAMTGFRDKYYSRNEETSALEWRV